MQSVILRTVNSTRRGGKVLDSSITTTEEVEGIIRRIEVNIDASGFGSNENVKVIFDGIEVACSSTQANSQGIFSGTFTIPEGIPTGTKSVRLQGTFTTGEAYFVGVHEVRQRLIIMSVTTILTR